MYYRFLTPLIVLVLCALTNSAGAARLGGFLQSGGTENHFPLPKTPVTLYEATTDVPVAVAHGITDKSGAFLLNVPNASSRSIYFAKADLGAGVQLMTIVGQTLRTSIVINELTTVAASYSMAQFLKTGVISGDAKALRIAAMMNDNLVDVTSGAPSAVLANAPNADQTNSLRMTRSLANLLAACTVNPAFAVSLKQLTRIPGDAPPKTTPQALANLARDPGRNVAQIGELTKVLTPYFPELTETPDAWTITVKINDSGNDKFLISGPGNILFDDSGYAWVTNNGMQGSLDSARYMLVFKPNGEPADGTNNTPVSPLFGGGLLGAGFGITRTDNGNIWVGNFGWGPYKGCGNYPSPNCSGSMSLFSPSGRAISPPTGIQGGPDRAQGIANDPWGNIWICSYGNYENNSPRATHSGDDTVYVFLNGNPKTVVSSYLYPGAQPFDVEVAPDGSVWVASGGGISGEYQSSLAHFALVKGQLKRIAFVSFGSAVKGISIDSLGNVWAASQGDNKIYAVNPNGVVIGSYSGGGVDGPWSVTVDGEDNIWVANFGPLIPGPYEARLSKLAGANAKTRPVGLAMGAPISPQTGYTVPSAGQPTTLHDGTPLYGVGAPPSYQPFQRMTNTMPDAAGNLWCLNNWKIDIVVDDLSNPGGDGIVIFVGLAAPPRHSKIKRPPECQ